jgi:hypothetical protein
VNTLYPNQFAGHAENHTAKGQISDYEDSPFLSLICLSVFVWADCVILGRPISLVTFTRRALLDANCAFLSVLLLRIPPFTDQIGSETI